MDVSRQLHNALSDRYRIEREIGAGGMATVYLAEDLKHRRRVALKVLRPELGAVLGPERFLTEINVTANLQHPHLLPLFDSGEADGLLFYVMPYVEGESLRARLERERQLPVDEAVRITVAVASALDYAHRHGVIHRDLKPENILLHDGQPLVADFGIALAVSNAGGLRVTQTGLSLGTPLYMSPEQATGDRVIDARSDVYSLAAVLYEMLTGEAPHSASTAQGIIARLMTEKPRSIRSVRPTVPVHVETAVERALEKLPADRFATAQAFSEVLSGRAVLEAATAAGAAPGPAPRQRATLASTARHPLMLAVAALAIVGWSGVLARPRPAADRGVGNVTVRFTLEPPTSPTSRFASSQPVAAVSPDGESVVVRFADANGVGSMGLRRLNSEGVEPLPSGDGWGAAFSADGRSLAIHTGTEIVRVDLFSARSAPVRVASTGGAVGLAWFGDQILAGSGSGPLRGVVATGGQLLPLMPLDSAIGEVAQRWPAPLPDGSGLLYMSVTNDGRLGGRPAVCWPGTGRRVYLDVIGIPLGFVDEQLVYAEPWDGRISAVSVDLQRGATAGLPVTLVEGATNAVLSPSGLLVYRAASSARGTQIVELDSAGAVLRVLPPVSRLESPRYSPDGRRVLATVRTDSAAELWVHDLNTGTFEPVIRRIYADRAEWSPDGRDILFASRRDGRFELWRQRADGTDTAVKVQGPSERGQPVQGIFSPDGRHLVYRTGYNGDDVWYRSLSGDTTSRAVSADPSFIERNTALSPDGRWAAYASSETGDFQVYIRAFPGPGPRRAVTVSGGDTPVWSPDGKRIIYINGAHVEEASVVLEPEFGVSRRRLFPHRAAVLSDWRRDWDLSADGTRFLVIRDLAKEEEELQPRIIVVHNWAAEVRRRMPR